MTSRPDDERRRAEMVTALGAVRARIAEACAAADRDPREVTLVAVTKNFPASDVATLADLGVLDIGENKDQEARAKVAELDAHPEIRWHMVGRLQTNKARSVASYAHAVHTVDRVKVANALAAAARERPDPLDVFVQVSMDADPNRGGMPIEGVPELAATIADCPELRLVGVMTVLPIGTDPDAGFALLAEISASLRAEHPGATAISAGMSGDLEAAVKHGSTHIRVGTALLGQRSQVLG
jgi:PLP dependent protein